MPWRLALRGCWRGRRFRLRSDSDISIFREVFIFDQYELRHHHFTKTDVVLDIGAHIGSFGFLAHLLGCRRLFSYEALAANYSLLSRNYRQLAGARPILAAVFRSDLAGAITLHHSGFNDFNTGGGNVLFKGSRVNWSQETLHASGDRRAEAVTVIGLDEILTLFPRVRMLKLDCEGSEFPILLTSHFLSRVEMIVGEYHEIPPALFRHLDEKARLPGMDRYSFRDLLARLKTLGFAVSSRTTAPNMGMFRAIRQDRSEA